LVIRSESFRQECCCADSLEIPISGWLRFFEVNVLSGVRLSRHYLPGMLKKNWGRLNLHLQRICAAHSCRNDSHGMTKTAQVAIARGLAESVAGTGVTVNSVLAGPTASEGASEFVDNMATQQGITKRKSKNSSSPAFALLLSEAFRNA